MKKRLLLSVVAGIALVGCSRIERIETQEMDQNAISFGTYVSNNAQTRASVIDEAALGIEGFGVNAYYTGQVDFSGTADPNYMDNTKITYNKDKDSWEYSPVKYWPNNDGDKVSFFAYGPYAASDGANNITQKGTSLSFTVPAEVKDQVDLVYHNQNTNPTLNLLKPAVDATVNFKFDHALSRVSFTVEAAVDETTNGNNLLDGNTRINVKKVMIVNGPFYQKGDLNLTDGTWSNQTGTNSEFSFSGTDHFYHTVKDKCAESSNEIDVIQLTRFNASKPQRVLNDESYLMIIPQENAGFKIYVEYDVISGGNDNNGSGTYDESAITNKITSADIITKTFEQGKAYNFNLVLGMTSVKFEVDEVTAWNESGGSQDEWLPENIDSTEDPEIKGLGTEEDPYRIANARQLERMRDNVNTSAEPPAGGVAWKSANYIQTADIDLSSVCSETIGNWTPIDDFSGKYDGQNHSITGLYYKSSEKDHNIGLFSYVYGSGYIKNLNVKGYIENTGVDTQAIGGIVGRVSGTGDNGFEISNCTFQGEILCNINDNGAYNIGGLCGEGDKALITDCHILKGSKITGYRQVSGICGMASSVHVIGCTNNAEIGGHARIAGIIGESSIWHGDYIVGCANYGYIHAEVSVAGIIADGSSIKIIGCYNTGKVEQPDGYDSVGGIINAAGNSTSYDDLPYGNTIIGCYNTGIVAGSSNCAVSQERESKVNALHISANYYGISESTQSEGIDGVSPFNTSDYQSAATAMNNAIKTYNDLTLGGESRTEDYAPGFEIDIDKYIHKWEYTTEGATAEEPLKLKYTAE